MSWSSSNRRAELPSNWPALRKQRKRIDGDRCTAKLDDGTRCTGPADEIDHHDQSRNWDHSIENLRSLCTWHHGKKSAREGAAAYWRNRRVQESKFRRTEGHPAFRS